MAANGLSVGFSEVDITPRKFPVRTYFSSATEVMDPLFARAAVFSNGAETLAIVSLDVVIVEWEYVERIRAGVAGLRDIAAEKILVCATHNHACPAVVDRPGSDKDDDYLDFMVEQTIAAVVEAFDNRKKSEVGCGRGFESRIAFNRRTVLKNGTVQSQLRISDNCDEVLFQEGIIDPGLGVVCVKRESGEIAGVLVNYSCHACHHMGDLSAGYPGVLAKKVKQLYGEDCVCLFLNGACGNVIHVDFTQPEEENLTKEQCGEVLADDVSKIVDQMSFSGECELAGFQDVVQVKYRDIKGLEENIASMERFNVFPSLIYKGWYKYSLEKLREMHERSDHEEAVLQVLRIGESVFAAVPAEYFSQLALKIKGESPVKNTFVVTLANGWLGYIPHREAFEREGGHESTWAVWSKMEVNAGDVIADRLVEMIKADVGCV